MKNSMKILSLLLVLALIFTACAGSSDDEEANEVPKESLEDREQLGDLEILGLAGGEEKVAISHIMKMESITKTMTNISSSGEVEEPAVTGIELDKILTQFGVRQNDFTGIRFYAADGYSIEIPGEILQK